MSQRHRSLIATAVLLLATAACARQPAPPTTQPVPPGTTTTVSQAPDGTGQWTITLERTGGVAGRHDRVTLASSGAWQRVDRAGTQTSGQLTDAQKRELDRLVTDPRLADEAGRTPEQTDCADAFTYRVTINSTTVSYEDCPSDAQLPPATMAIVALVESATT